jgi:quinolinate synthase
VPESTAALFDRIEAVRKRLGPRLTILAHHYQIDEVYRHADHSGDSLELARRIPGLDAERIVFCGVWFMAESAAILARAGQSVFIPEDEAWCMMSATAPAPLLAATLGTLTSGGRRLIPLAYVNSSAEVKAVCGRYGGAVCTSANASRMLEWAFAQGDGVLFLPDKNLAMNTADALGVPPERRAILDVRGGGARIDAAGAAGMDLLVWPGSCAVHARIKPAHVRAARERDPDALVIVHPECSPEVVAMADASGSTSKIIRFVADAPPDSTIYVGTEVTMVDRLARLHAPGKRVLSLCRSQCSHMAKTTEAKLAALLEDLEGAGAVPPVRVDESVRYDAGLALERMLAACA